MKPKELKLEELSECCGANFFFSHDNSKTLVCSECYNPCKINTTISRKAAQNLLKYINEEIKKHNNLTSSKK